MKSDVNGCSTCFNGTESYEEFYSNISKKKMVQYDYRTPSGLLFSTCAPNLDVARSRRDKWLSEQSTKPALGA